MRNNSISSRFWVNWRSNPKGTENTTSKNSPNGRQTIATGNMTAGYRLTAKVKLHSLVKRHSASKRTGWPVKLVAFCIADVLNRQGGLRRKHLFVCVGRRRICRQYNCRIKNDFRLHASDSYLHTDKYVTKTKKVQFQIKKITSAGNVKEQPLDCLWMALSSYFRSTQPILEADRGVKDPSLQAAT